jgi:hypothetical protein
MSYLPEIEARNYTYCSATYHAPELTFRKFLVMTPYVTEAQERAHAYARQHWGEPDNIHYYPRNYVRKARDLYLLGLHD